MNRAQIWRVPASALFLSLVGVGCGGSNSETPFPLEPDFDRPARSAPERNVVMEGGQSKREPTTPEPDAPPPAEDAASPTWGSSKAPPAAPAAEPEAEPNAPAE